MHVCINVKSYQEKKLKKYVYIYIYFLYICMHIYIKLHVKKVILLIFLLFLTFKNVDMYFFYIIFKVTLI